MMNAFRKRKTLLRVRSVAVTITIVAGLAAAAPVHAQVTSAIPLATTPPAPQAGTLPNGVNWTINVGSWIPPQGYASYPPTGAQVWTFDQPVSVRFGVAGLNLAGECFEVPIGTIEESINAAHAWDPITRRVCRTGSSGPGNESVFTLAGPVTDLTLGIVGGSNSAGRGPTFIEVTTQAPSPSGPPFVGPPTLANMVACQPFSQILTATAGASPYVFSVSAGVLPPNLTLTPTGPDTAELAGTPAAAGPYSFTITATDTVPDSGSTGYFGFIAAPPAIGLAPATLPAMTQGVAFSEVIVPGGGTGPFTFNITSGSLPAGLTLNASTGEISGTPTTSGPYDFAVTVADSACATGSLAFSGNVIGVVPTMPPAALAALAVLLALVTIELYRRRLAA